MKIVEVLIEYANNSLNRPFSYFYKGYKRVDTGFRVLVNFNHRELVGYVINCYDYNEPISSLEEKLGFKIGEVIDVIDESPLLNQDLLDLADQVTDYYLSPKISVLQSMLPPSLSPRKSSLKAPKIAYDQYVYTIDKNEDGLTDKQIELLRLISSVDKVLKRDIKQVSILNKLIENKRVDILKVEKRRLAIPSYEYKEPPKLTVEQQRVVDEFKNTNDSVYLLEGVTGSGKTEVYLNLSEQVLKEGKSVLMLVPEISLTPMMMEYYLRRFEGDVAILHSALTPAEKYDEYRKIASGECHIVVGARSAIFAPLSNIGLIILDEEHVESYKQDTPPFYHAREVAIMRGKQHNAKVLLGSATPSLDSRARAQKNVYHLLKLETRINNKELPKTTIINLGDYRNIDRDSYIFSPTCDIALTYHRTDNMLKCHHCEYVCAMPDKCPECGDDRLIKIGFGTERIEEEVHRLFPNARTLRLDSDSAKIRAKIPAIIEEFRQKHADILIGTQMIAKGHDFPDVTLVGVVLADIGLSMPTYRSNEMAFQLITQAIGRSGRKDKNGIAIIQTYIPNHYAITIAARQNYEMFYRQEMEYRRLQSYPPYTFLASITIAGKNEETVIINTQNLIDMLNNQFGDKAQVLGPTTPYVPYEGNKILRTCLIKCRDQKLLHDVLSKIIRVYSNRTSINVSVNIDPYNF